MHGMGTRMGKAVVFAYNIEKHAHPIKRFISKKIYYFEVHMQKGGQLDYHTWKWQIAKQC